MLTSEKVTVRGSAAELTGLFNNSPQPDERYFFRSLNLLCQVFHHYLNPCCTVLFNLNEHESLRAVAHPGWYTKTVHGGSVGCRSRSMSVQHYYCDLRSPSHTGDVTASTGAKCERNRLNYYLFATSVSDYSIFEYMNTLNVNFFPVLLLISVPSQCWSNVWLPLPFPFC